VKYLVVKGADVKADNEFGQTPLHRAAVYGHLDVMNYLKEKAQ
jgi:ankyrin repeat protein